MLASILTTMLTIILAIILANILFFTMLATKLLTTLLAILLTTMLAIMLTILLAIILAIMLAILLTTLLAIMLTTLLAIMLTTRLTTMITNMSGDHADFDANHHANNQSCPNTGSYAGYQPGQPCIGKELKGVAETDKTTIHRHTYIATYKRNQLRGVGAGSPVPVTVRKQIFGSPIY